jgi:hypothetical protein
VPLREGWDQIIPGAPGAYPPQRHRQGVDIGMVLISAES